jgi:hypothetical protein
LNIKNEVLSESGGSCTASVFKEIHLFLIPPGKSFAMVGQEKGNHHSCKGRKKPGYAHFNEEGEI